MPTRFDTYGHAFDSNADYGELWTAVHDYLAVQNTTSPDPQAITAALGRLFEAHNMIWERYIAPNEQPLQVAGT